MTWLALIVAAAASAGLTPIVIGLLSRGGVYDVPNPRSSHDRPVPRGGGIAVGPAMLLALWLRGVVSISLSCPSRSQQALSVLSGW